MLFNHLGLHMIWLPRLAKHLGVGSWSLNSIMMSFLAKHSIELAFNRANIARSGISGSHMKLISLQPLFMELTWFGTLLLHARAHRGCKCRGCILCDLILGWVYHLPVPVQSMHIQSRWQLLCYLVAMFPLSVIWSPSGRKKQADCLSTSRAAPDVLSHFQLSQRQLQQETTTEFDKLSFWHAECPLQLQCQGINHASECTYPALHVRDISQ